MNNVKILFFFFQSFENIVRLSIELLLSVCQHHFWFVLLACCIECGGELSVLSWLKSTVSPTLTSDSCALLWVSAYSLLFAFSSVSQSHTSWSVCTSVRSGSFPLSIRLKSNSAGLLPVVGWMMLLQTITYFLSSFFQSSPSDWAILILFISDAFWHSTSPWAWACFSVVLMCVMPFPSQNSLNCSEPLSDLH